MNYKSVYIRLILNAAKTDGIVSYLKSKSKLGLVRHHINYEHLPYFIEDLEDPINDCVYLTYKEHALAHMLIAKAYPNPGKNGENKHLFAGYIQNNTWFKANVFKGNKLLDIFHSPQYKKLMQDLAVNRWAIPEYYNENINKIIENGKSTRFTSEKMIEKWKDLKYKEKQLNILLNAGEKTRFKPGVRNNPKGEFTSEQIQKRNIENWKDPKYREHMIKILQNNSKNFWKSDPIKGRKIYINNGIKNSYAYEFDIPKGWKPGRITNANKNK